MATIDISVRIEKGTYDELTQIIEKANFTLTEIINATLYNFAKMDVHKQYEMTSYYKWLKRHDQATLDVLQERQTLA